MEYIVKLSCEPGHFIATLDMNDKTFEGFGECLSDSLIELAEEIAYEEYYPNV